MGGSIVRTPGRLRWNGGRLWYPTNHPPRRRRFTDGAPATCGAASCLRRGEPGFLLSQVSRRGGLDLGHPGLWLGGERENEALW